MDGNADPSATPGTFDVLIELLHSTSFKSCYPSQQEEHFEFCRIAEAASFKWRQWGKDRNGGELGEEGKVINMKEGREEGKWEGEIKLAWTNLIIGHNIPDRTPKGWKETGKGHWKIYPEDIAKGKRENASEMN